MVANASSTDGAGAALTYDFQVAVDQTFFGILAERIGQPQGSDGTTSWRVEPALADGRYYWRARAVGPRGPGNYSPGADFTTGAAGGPPPSSPSPSPSPTPSPGPTSPSPSPSGGFLSDPLTNGTSVGEVVGGRFISSGWQVQSRGDFIRYRIPTITSGFVEWENRGLAPRNPQRDLYTLFGMWDPTAGDYRENPYRVHLRKLDTQGHNSPYLRMRWISGGDQRDVGWDFLDWVPSRTYRWRVEWGPTGSGNEARVYLDDRVVIRTGYGPAYRPEQHWVEMGVEERAESIIGVVFRNVRIGRR